LEIDAGSLKAVGTREALALREELAKAHEEIVDERQCCG
jgi:hypothetical protein